MTKSQIQEELKSAMIAKDQLKLSTLRMLLSAIQSAEVSGEKHEVTEEEIATIIQREVKRHKESIEEYRNGAREDLAAQEERELVILQAYLPTQLSSEEIESLATAAIATCNATTAQDFGRVMKELAPQIKGNADGKTVSEIVRRLIG